MEFVAPFFTELDGPASLAFIGIVTGFFLLGLLPAGLAYVSRIKDAKRKLANHISAYQRASQERNILQGQLEREQAKTAEYADRLKTLMSDRAALDVKLSQLQAALDGAQAETLAAQVAKRDHEDYVSSLRGKVSALSGQVQSLKAAARPQAPSAGFDLNLVSSNKTLRAKNENLEKRVDSLLADNEQLRRQLAS